MTIKRVSLLLATLLISLICVGVMNIHYDVLSRYTYDISDTDADKLRENLTYKEINYLIEYSINSDFFIDYIEEDGFNVYHFDFYNKIRDIIGGYYTNGQIVYLAEKAIKQGLDQDDVINKMGMGYNLELIIEYNRDGYAYSKKEVLATDPLNYDFKFSEGETIYTLMPYDLVTVDFISNKDSHKLRSRVADQLDRCLNAVDNAVKFNVYDSVELSSGFKSYATIEKLVASGDKSVIPGKNYYQLGRVVTLECSGRNEDEFFNEFDKVCSKYGFELVNGETHTYLYSGN